MPWRHNGHNLWTVPTGTADGMLTVWRGFRLDQHDPRTGMPSSDLQAGNFDAITKLIRAINTDDREYVARQIQAHTHNHNKTGILTPFVSVGPTEKDARNYCREPGEMLGKIAVHHTRVIPGGLWENTELLVIGGIMPREIISVNFGTPPPNPYVTEATEQPFSLSSMLDA